jgi:NADPH-dependent curcumin reductase CurA
VVASASTPFTAIPEIPGVSPRFFLGASGMTGLTAYVGMFDIGRAKPGETVVVSAAAGAVGSVAGQLAKIQGARVVGIAGGEEKCALLTGELGFDAAVDYKVPDWRDQLKAATPDGIDVDFENVGGEIMEAAFGRLNVRARVALCGLISGYNDDAAAAAAGPRNFGNLLIQRVRLEGFIVLDHFGRAPEIVPQLAGWIAEGKLTARETVVDGFERLPVAINMLFDGENTGKLVVRL